MAAYTSCEIGNQDRHIWYIVIPYLVQKLFCVFLLPVHLLSLFLLCSKIGDSLWDIGIEQHALSAGKEGSTDEKHLLILGNKNSVSY